MEALYQRERLKSKLIQPYHGLFALPRMNAIDSALLNKLYTPAQRSMHISPLQCNVLLQPVFYRILACTVRGGLWG